MKIETLNLPPLDNNCYIVSKDNKAIIIDPSSSEDTIIEACKKYEVVEILVTHHHFDHIGALSALEKHYNIKHNEYKNTFNYKVINTPGHSNDSVSFYFEKEKILFSGDFIFQGTIGRYDFPESDPIEMKKSLDMISKYPDNIKIYPGHGDTTILGVEKNNFKYFI